MLGGGMCRACRAEYSGLLSWWATATRYHRDQARDVARQLVAAEDLCERLHRRPPGLD